MAREEEKKMNLKEANEEINKLENEKLELIRILHSTQTSIMELNLKMKQIRRGSKFEQKPSPLRTVKNGPTKETKDKLLEERGFRCEECDSIVDITIHHKLPLSDGGTNRKDNLILLCNDCHSKKHRI